MKRMAVCAVALLALAGCGGSPSPSPSPTPSPSVSPTPSASPSVSPSPVAMPCDPSFGDPKPKAGCPHDTLVTGWLQARDGALTLRLFRTLHSDAEGQAYAAEHDLEFPFPNDYYDAPTGKIRAVTLAPTTICTGAIQVGHMNGEDNVVPCRKMANVAGRKPRLPVAVWGPLDQPVQVSELYRP